MRFCFWALLPGTQPARPRVRGKTNGVYTCNAGLGEPLDEINADHKQLGNCWFVKHRILEPVHGNSPYIPVLFQSKSILHIFEQPTYIIWMAEGGSAANRHDKIIWTTHEETQGKLHVVGCPYQFNVELFFLALNSNHDVFSSHWVFQL